MTKSFTPYLKTFFLASSVLLVSCGQKGALSLPVSQEVEGDKIPDYVAGVPDVPVQKGRVTTSLLVLESLTIDGTLAQLNHTKPRSWQALLSTQASQKDRVRYVIFDGDILGKESPLDVLVGQVQNKTFASNNSQRTLSAGYYLRIRSLETGVTYLPALMAQANEYLVNNPTVKRAENSARTDFLIESDKNIDLYLSVEQK